MSLMFRADTHFSLKRKISQKVKIRRHGADEWAKLASNGANDARKNIKDVPSQFYPCSVWSLVFGVSIRGLIGSYNEALFLSSPIVSFSAELLRRLGLHKEEGQDQRKAWHLAGMWVSSHLLYPAHRIRTKEKILLCFNNSDLFFPY